MVKVNRYLDRIQGDFGKCDKIADALLAGPRMIHQGRSFHVFKNDKGDVINAMVESVKTPTKCQRAWQIFLGILLSIVSPVGFALKACSLSRQQAKFKDGIDYLEKQQVLFCYDKLKLAPTREIFDFDEKKKEVSDSDLSLFIQTWDQVGARHADKYKKDVEDMKLVVIGDDINNILNLWDSTNSTDPLKDKIRHNLEMLIKNSHPSQLDPIPFKDRDSAAEEIQFFIKGIAFLLTDLKKSDNTKEELIKKLSEVSKKPATEWVEDISIIYYELADPVRGHLMEFIKKAQDPNTFDHVPGNNRQEASDQLVLYLKLTAKLLYESKKNEDEKERILLELRAASRVCPPTWMEAATKKYYELKGMDSLENTLLGYLQSVKEEIILNEVQKDAKDVDKILKDIKGAFATQNNIFSYGLGGAHLKEVDQLIKIIKKLSLSKDDVELKKIAQALDKLDKLVNKHIPDRLISLPLKEKINDLIQATGELDLDKRLLLFASLDNVQWHALNQVREEDGDFLGLDTSSLKYDSAKGYKHDPKFSKDKFRNVFLSLYQTDVAIQGLITKINMNSDQKEKNDIMQLLAQIDEDAAKAEDPAMYVIENFTEHKDGKTFNDDAGYILLNHLNVLEEI